jgi:hypothetical protein
MSNKTLFFNSVIAMQQADSKRALSQRIISHSYCNIIQTKELDLLAIILIKYYIAAFKAAFDAYSSEH